MARPIFGANSRTQNSAPTGISNGTPGGRKGPAGIKGLQVGDEMYLWFLVFIEVALMAFLRNHFRRYHGG